MESGRTAALVGTGPCIRYIQTYIHNACSELRGESAVVGIRRTRSVSDRGCIRRTCRGTGVCGVQQYFLVHRSGGGGEGEAGGTDHQIGGAGGKGDRHRICRGGGQSHEVGLVGLAHDHGSASVQLYRVGGGRSDDHGGGQ